MLLLSLLLLCAAVQNGQQSTSESLHKLIKGHYTEIMLKQDLVGLNNSVFAVGNLQSRPTRREVHRELQDTV